MVVGICGFGNTGASSVSDYLRGYDDIYIFDKVEFQLLHQPDGINDLKYHLVYSKERITCNVAIKRFIRTQKYGMLANQLKRMVGRKKYDGLWKKYISDLTIASWNGEASFVDPIDITNRPKNFFWLRVCNQIDAFLKKINNKFHLFPYQQRFFSLLDEEHFNFITKKFLCSIFDLLEFDLKKTTVVDMLFSSTNPTQGSEFFEDAKSILVVRDPRDLYVTAKLHPNDSRFMPNDDVYKFVDYYRTLLATSNKTTNSTNVLIVHYEDMIYDYKNTTKKIIKFLGIKSVPSKEFLYFNPLISRRYTHRVNLYNSYQNDIKIIENLLSDFLYDFQSKSEPSEDIELKESVSKCREEYKGFNLK